MSSFKMPPALVGDENNEVSPDGDGFKNFAMAVGSLTVTAIAGGLAFMARDRIFNLAEKSASGEDENGGLSLRGSL